MNTLLAVSPSEALPLIERVNEGKASGADYPLVFGSDAPGRVIAVGEAGDDPRSACAILAREFVTPQGVVKVGLIGSVATDPQHQGQGLATRVLIEAEAELTAQGCHVSLLWANDAKFYYARGYRPLGAEVDVELKRELAAKLPVANDVRPMTPGDAPAIHALYMQHESRVERSAEETARLLQVPGMTTLVVESAGQVTGYACLGRGKDLENVIHEWGGTVQDVLKLIRAQLEQRFADSPPAADQLLFLMAPVTASTLVEHLVGLGCDASIGILGLGRVLNRETCATLLDGLLGESGTAEYYDGAEGKGVAFSCPDGQGLLNDDLLLTVLFPALGLDQDVEEFRKSFGLTTARFPVDLFAWGLDSI